MVIKTDVKQKLSFKSFTAKKKSDVDLLEPCISGSFCYPRSADHFALQALLSSVITVNTPPAFIISLMAP